MSLTAKLRRAPLRIATGAYILNSGFSKFSADDEASKNLHYLASGGLPPIAKVDHKIFIKAVAVSEIALGGALVLPIIPVGVAGLGLAAFSGALATMYWKTPGTHQQGSIRPTQQGQALAKDVWVVGIAGGLLVDAVTTPVHDKRVEVTATVAEKVNGRAARKARREAKQNRKEAIAQAKVRAEHTRVVAMDAAVHAREQAKDVAAQAREQARDVAAKVQASDVAAQVREQAKDAAAQAKELSSHARDYAKEHAKDLTPKVKDIANTAADTARDVSNETGRRARKAAAKAAAKAAKARAA